MISHSLSLLMMGLGFGALKNMVDVMRYNRSLLPKHKSPREVYKEEIKKLNSRYDHVDVRLVRERVEKKLKRNRVEESIGRISGILFVALAITGFGWLVYIFATSFSEKPERAADEFQYFYSKRENYDDGLSLKKDYYLKGAVASETYFKNGLKHQNSESYYQTGEQFRSALYYYDTLITEVYLYKNGDTIPNFPTIDDYEIHHLTMLSKDRSKKIEFDFYDFKILKNSYQETPVESGN